MSRLLWLPGRTIRRPNAAAPIKDPFEDPPPPLPKRVVPLLCGVEDFRYPSFIATWVQQAATSSSKQLALALEGARKTDTTIGLMDFGFIFDAEAQFMSQGIFSCGCCEFTQYVLWTSVIGLSPTFVDKVKGVKRKTLASAIPLKNYDKHREDKAKDSFGYGYRDFSQAVDFLRRDVYSPSPEVPKAVVRGPLVRTHRSRLRDEVSIRKVLESLSDTHAGLEQGQVAGRKKGCFYYMHDVPQASVLAWTERFTIYHFIGAIRSKCAGGIRTHKRTSRIKAFSVWIHADYRQWQHAGPDFAFALDGIGEKKVVIDRQQRANIQYVSRADIARRMASRERLYGPDMKPMTGHDIVRQVGGRIDQGVRDAAREEGTFAFLQSTDPIRPKKGEK